MIRLTLIARVRPGLRSAISVSAVSILSLGISIGSSSCFKTELISSKPTGPAATTSATAPAGGGTPDFSRIDHLAGQYSLAGALDGTGTDARFNYPTGVASDGTNLYVADSSNNTIRAIALATGSVTTLAGKAGTSGFADGAGTDATFSSPSRIATDGTSLYVADSGNSTIRKIMIASRQVTTLAGTAGMTGSADGIGAAAAFNQPFDVATDGTNVYVLDNGSSIIRKVVIATGNVSTLVGAAAGLYFNRGSGITISGSTLFVVENGNMDIREVDTTSGNVTTLVGGFDFPMAVATDGTSLYVAENGNWDTENNSVIYKVAISTGDVTLFAGAPHTAGSADGIGAGATFNVPQGMAIVGGDLFVADSSNNTIRKIVISSASVTTFAGLAPTVQSFGSANGAGENARFNFPLGAVSDGSNLYVADSGNNTIRMIGIATGAVSTLAGTAGNPGSSDGTGASASFNSPTGVATDGTNVFVADSGNATIRKIVIASGAVSTLAGVAGSAGSADGTALLARFSSPYGITTDGTSLYVTDSGNQTIRQVVISTGATSTLAGTAGASGSADGTGGAARFERPLGIVTDGSVLYVVDQNNQTIRTVVINGGGVATLAGSPGVSGGADGVGSAANFNAPNGITIMGSNLYVADSWNSAVRQVAIGSAAVTTLFTGFNFLLFGGGIASAGGNLYIVETGNNDIKIADIATLSLTTFAGQAPYGSYGFSDGPGASASMSGPQGFAAIGQDLYFADAWNNTIRRLNLANGTVSTMAGMPGVSGSSDGIGRIARFSSPTGMATDGTDLFVLDSGNNTIRKVIPSTGDTVTIAGTAGSTGSADGAGSAASFNFNWGGRIASDGANLYFSDFGNNTIRKMVISTGAVSTLAGAAGAAGSADGSGSGATFNGPTGVAIGGTTLYVIDSGNDTVRTINAKTGAVTTLAGSAGSAGAADGVGSAARFSFTPGYGGLAIDGQSLFVTDTLNCTIRQISVSGGAVTTLVGAPSKIADLDGLIAAPALLDFPTDLTSTPMGLVTSDFTSLRWIH